MAFDRAVAPNGYAWWYIDALSEDGRHGITLIAFVGSVFSPYYAWQRRRGHGDPLQHCALNVALYGLSRGWAMTERGSAARSADSLAIGPSSLRWDGTALTIDIHERTAPFGERLRGSVRVTPAALTGRVFPLDAARVHHWSPLAPRVHVEVSLKHPALHWSGPGYLDANRGNGPLEASFVRWTWSRAVIGARTAILYDVAELDGSTRSLALVVDDAGQVSDFPAPPVVTLRPTRWRVVRETRADAPATVRATLEDTPFYARSIIDTHVLGQAGVAMHESLSLERFRQPWVQAMLPFRMPRRK